MKLEEKITLHRKRNGWSQEELAFRLDVSRQAVSKWEMGSSVPDLDKIIKLADLFGVSVDELVRDTDNPSDHQDFQNLNFTFPWMADETIWKSLAGLLCSLGVLCMLWRQFILGPSLLVAACLFVILPKKYWLVGIWLSVSIGLILDVPNGGWISIVSLISLCLCAYNSGRNR